MIRLRGPPVDLEVARGEVVLLRGPNGCGKTSLLRALAGLASPLSPQEVMLDGHDPRALPAPRAAALASLSPQEPTAALAGLTVRGEFRMRGRDVTQAVLHLQERDVATLSSGEARRVTLALAGRAPLLLLDEPAEGLDAEGRVALRALVVAARERGAVVAADHGGALDGLATRVVQVAPEPEPDLPAVPAPAGDAVLRASAVALRGRALPSLALPPGLHVLRGPNGGGKSTRLLSLAGLLEGDATVDGRPARAGRDVRLCLPDARAHLTRDAVRDELAASDGEIVAALVPGHLLPRHPLTLSGGEARRVALAKTLGRPARAYLLDEPDAHLDGAGRAALLRVVARRIGERACVLVATHDEALTKRARSVVEVPS